MAPVPERADPTLLRVLTYNTHHGADRAGRLDIEGVALTIEAGAADLIALQEVDRHWGPRSDWLDQPAWYATRLGLHVTFAATIGEPPARPGSPRREYGLALLSQWPLTQPVHRLYRRASTRGSEPRGLVQALVTVHAAGLATPVRMIDTHLSAAAARLRRHEITELIAHTDAGADVATVVAGDFNAGARSPAIRAMRSRFSDAWMSGSGPATTVPGRRIDYVWTNQHLHAVQAMVIRSTASDHFAVVTDLAWTTST